MKYTHIPALTREIKRILDDTKDTDTFPVILQLHEGMECPEFSITIEKTSVDTYTDSTGQKWKKVK